MAADDKSDSKVPGKFIQSFSLALVVLRQRKWRRNLLFGFTLLTIFLVFAGVVILGDRLMESPIAFLLFWGICFVLVGVVLILALLDLMIVRREHRGRIRELNRKLADTAAEVEEKIAEAELEQQQESASTTTDEKPANPPKDAAEGAG